MPIVLVCLKNFQEYILTNIKQLIRLGHKDIYVLTNHNLFSNFQEYKNDIQLIDVDLLEDTYYFLERCNTDMNFRGGFWALTSLRFFYIYAFMIKYQIENVIHLENDVLVYGSCDKLITKIDNNYMYMPFDSFTRNIGSIMYIPNVALFKRVLDRYSPYETDMKNFVRIREETGCIQLFPIFCEENSTEPEIAFVSSNFNKFEYIFDGAAIGQYVGGIDPRNNPDFYSVGISPISNDDYHVGFVSSDCVIKYDKYGVFWRETNGIKTPFTIVNNVEIPIFNLHIHSKKLYKYI
jgi:hypothetical protein